MKLRNWFFYTIIALLLVIGIVGDLMFKPWMIIIPVVIFGVIFYLWKRPPAFLTGKKKSNNSHYRATSHVTRQAKPKKDRPRSKTVPFKVIEGGRDDNDTPRYH